MPVSTNGEAMATWCDVTDEAEVGRVGAEIRSHWGPVEILVCCAGGDIGAGGTAVGKGGRPDDDDCLAISLPDIKSVLDRNLLGTILCCREVAPDMIQRRQGTYHHHWQHRGLHWTSERFNLQRRQSRCAFVDAMPCGTAAAAQHSRQPASLREER